MRPRSRFDQEELPRLEPALAQDVLRRNVEHAGLGGEHHPTVPRLEPATGTQAVAIERRADQPTVGERHRRRPVPRFSQALVEGIEPAQLVRHIRTPGVCLRHHHHQRVRQRATREDEQLEHVVEDRGVGAAGLDDRQHLRDVVAEELRGELRLARPHPVDVAAQRVDLAVVSDHAIRVGELPARERVRREARVHEGERARQPLVGQVREEAPELRRRQHSLVDERPRRKARECELGSGGAFGHPPDHVEPPLEHRRVAGELGRRRNEELADARGEEQRLRTDVPVVDRHVTPAEHRLPLRRDHLLEQALELQPPGALLREEADRDPVGAEGRQRDPRDTPEKRVRHLHENPGAVAGFGVGPRRSAVLEVLERGERARDRLVRLRSVEPGHERHAARVVLEGRVVEPRRLHRLALSRAHGCANDLREEVGNVHSFKE